MTPRRHHQKHSRWFIKWSHSASINRTEKVQEQRGTKHKSLEPTSPPCLNETCRTNVGKHFIKNCPNTAEKQKQVLFGHYRTRKKESWQHRKNLRQVSSTSLRRNTTKLPECALSEESLSEGILKSMLMEDQGADTNLIPMEVFDRTMTDAPDRQEISIQPPLQYTRIRGDIVVYCTKKATTYIF